MRTYTNEYPILEDLLASINIGRKPSYWFDIRFKEMLMMNARLNAERAMAVSRKMRMSKGN